MGRAHGRHTGRKPTIIKPDTPEGDDIGLSARQQGQGSPEIQGQGSPIPGGRDHIGNAATVAQQAPIPEPREEFRGMMAHGVQPGTHTAHERAESMRGPNDLKPLTPSYAREKAKPPVPVPVYIVPERAGSRPLKTAVCRHILVPALNADPVCICGKDPNRTKIRLMNDDASIVIRFASDPTALLQDPGTSGGTVKVIGGAKLPAAMTGYQDIETQDELWAIAQSASTAAELSIIMETSVANGVSKP